MVIEHIEYRSLQKSYCRPTGFIIAYRNTKLLQEVYKSMQYAIVFYVHY